MPLSSVVGAQSIVKPGVCTSSTRPASPYDGQVIYETDTDRAMVYNGTGWVVLSTGRANSLGLDLVKTQTIGTAVSSVTVSDVFSSTYDNYLIQISGGVTSATMVTTLRLGSTATGYKHNLPFSTYGSTTISNDTNASGTSLPYSSQGNTTSHQGNFTLLTPFIATTTKYWSTYINVTESGVVTGLLNDTTSYTAFTLTANTGTMTGGTIAVYGYAK